MKRWSAMGWLGRSPTDLHPLDRQRRYWYHWLGVGLGITGGAIAAIGFSLPFWPWPTMAEQALAKQLGVPVQVDRLTVDVLAGWVRVDGLTIHNPPGFRTPYLARIQSITFAGSLLPWLGRANPVEQLTIQGVTLHLEQRLLSTNLSTLLSRLRDRQSTQIVTIGQFALRNLTIQVTVTGWGRSPIHHRLILPDLVESNITTQALRDRILQQVVQQAIAAVWQPKQVYQSAPSQPHLRP